MPVPQSWDDIFTNPAQNNPQGSEPIGTNADDYLRQAFAFIKQLHDGWLAADGTTRWAANQDANGFQIKNLAAPTDTGDAVTLAYLTAMFPRGTVIMWFGTAATIPAGWLQCNGQNGTPDMRDRMAMGAGGSMVQGILGGNSFPVITAAQMPVHNHGVNDPGHAHGVYDPGHAHSVSDPGHSHTLPIFDGSVGNAGHGVPALGGTLNSGVSASNIGIYASGTNISIYGSGTGISLGNAGGNAAFDNRPAFNTLFYIMKA